MNIALTTTRILLVEDNPGDAELLRAMLASAPLGPFEVETVGRLSEGLPLAASGDYDILVLDLALPDSTGIETLDAMRRAAPRTPIVVLTGQNNERVGLEALNRGAQDYLAKGEIDGPVLARALQYSIQRRRWQDQMIRQDQLLGDAQRIAKLGSFEWDMTSDDVIWSDELYRIYGVTRESYLPTRESFLERVHDDDRARVAETMLHAAASGAAFDFEYRIVRPGEDYLVAHVCGHVAPNAGGGSNRIVGTLQDITERKKLEQSLHLAGRMSSIGTLAAGVAHEINNPLAYVVANLELMGEELRGNGTTISLSQARELVDMIDEARQGADRIRRIVKGLKSFSRADEEIRVPIDLRPMLELSINMTLNQFRYRAHLVKDFGPTPLVNADEARLSQVFVNLIVNAAHAIGDGQDADDNQIRIVTFTDDAGCAVVQVRDTGPGIRESDRARIFDPFFTTKAVGEGTGLGLSICHGIVTAHGGQIAVESCCAQGTTIRVTLPAARTDDLPFVRQPEAAVAVGRRGRVLVVDDEPLVAGALRRMLAAEHEIVVAGNGAEALALLEREERFDAIICDLMMPTMNGIELYERLMLTHSDQAQRMIFVTGGAFTRATQAFLDRVPNQRIDKPFNNMSIRGLIRNLVR